MGAVITALSAIMVKNQVYGGAPTTLRYSVFTGAIAMIIAAIGLICLFIHKIPPFIPMVIDAVGALLLVAGGIAWAVGLKGIKCHPAYFTAMYGKPLLNEGCFSDRSGNTICGVDFRTSDETDPNTHTQKMFDIMNGRCKTGMADEIIQFVAFAVCVILVVLGYFIMRKGGLGSSSRGRFVA
jgi:hypothetical protein